MNTHECYVSLEVAKLLKEAGFDWKCREYYYNFTTTGWSLCFDDSFENWNNWGEQRISAPTLDIAQKWLREVKGYIVEVLWFKKDFDYQGMVIEDEHYRWISSYPVTFQIEGKDVYDILHDKDGKNYSTYEEAQEAGIKKVLEIILEKGL